MSFAEAVTARVPSRLLPFFVKNAELLKFITVGIIAWITTTVLFFTLKSTVLQDKTVTANVVATLIATVVNYILSREWSFTARGGLQRRHEAPLFFLVAGISMGINQVPLWFSVYVCQLRTPHVSLTFENIADFVSGPIIGTLLATAFRWWAMRKFVFPHPVSSRENSAVATNAVDET